uniref:Uncharacterized protein n=1 Tax=Anopheles stephensi TaxID=30069 RepID=A0A182YS98_ANOST
MDIDTILGSNRLVSNYVDCLLSRKPCPPEGKDLKRKYRCVCLFAWRALLIHLIDPIARFR